MPVVVGMSNLREVRRGRRCMGVGQGRGRQEELERSPALAQAGTVFLGQLGVIHSLQKR